MSKTKILLGIMLITSLLTTVTHGKEPTQYIYTLSYIFENRGTTDFELTQEDVSIPMFMNTSKQTVILEEIDQEYTIKIIDSDSNRGAIIGINRLLLPGQEESFTAKYTISSIDQETPSFELDKAQDSDKIPQNLIDEFTLSTETFPAEDPTFNELASNIVSDEDTVLESVAALVEYIIENTTYCNFEVPKYPSNTLEDQLGDCDDQSILLITLCRSLNIPAYLQVGIYIHPAIDDKDSSWDGHLINEADGVGWHGWAMIYIPPWGWVPVDLTLMDSDSGLELIRSAPEYGSNIISVLNVSTQSYIGETLTTRERIVNSPLYVRVSDVAHEVYYDDNLFQNYVLLGLGAALLLAVGLMFYSSRK